MFYFGSTDVNVFVFQQMYLYLCLLCFCVGKLVFVVQLLQIFVFQLTDMFCVSASHIT